MFSLMRVVASVAFLNALLTLHNIWPTPWVKVVPELSVELFVALLAMALFLEMKIRAGRMMVVALTIIFIVLAVGRYADVTAPALFGRPINLYWDVRHIPNVAAMLVESAAIWRVVATIVAGLVFVGVFVGIVVFALKTIVAGFQSTGMRRVSALGCVVFIGIYSVGMTRDDVHTEGWFAIPVAPVYARQAAFLLKAGRPTDASGVTPTTTSDMAHVKGRDVFLIFFESYGATAFDAPRLANGLAQERAALDTMIEATGWNVASVMVESPTYGGASWLAHSSVLSGRWLANQGDYKLFLTHPSETLVDRFRALGHRTIALAPGIKRPWPEGSAYGFDAILDAKALDYGGPAFGWWAIPDQFSLARFLEREVGPNRDKPVFVFFPTIMSHMPFGPTPPYQPDWAQLTKPDPFAGTDLAEALTNLPDYGDLPAAYIRTIRHNYRLLRGFLESHAPKDSLIIVVGDHQPSAIISGKEASWNAPIHIFTRDAEMLNSFMKSGFTSGFDPRGAMFGRMHLLHEAMLKAMDSKSARGLAQR
jgi:hypothetical protein